MLYLNLLSPQKKQEMEQKIIFAIFGNLAEMILLILIVSSIILLSAKVILKNNFETVVAQSALINREFGDINQQIRKLNKELASLSSIQKDFVLWSDFFRDLSKITPAGVRLTNIFIDKNSKNVAISGFAAERIDFLQLKNNLTNNFAYLSNLDSPIANILLPRDINFEFKGTLDDSKL
ncbi:MAG: hypothetical protein AAB731_03190 [Patescibacteria group bacterium]